MSHLFNIASGALVAVALAVPAFAEDFALVLTNRIYANGQETSAFRFDDAARPLRAAGFQIYGGDNLVAPAMARKVQDFRAALSASEVDRIVVLTSGRVVSGQGGPWLLAREAGQVDDLLAPMTGLSLQSLNGLLAEYPGQALMVIAPAWRTREAPGFGLTVGVADFEPAQGVTLLTGEGRDLLPVLSDVLNADEPLVVTAAGLGAGASLRGYLPRHQGFGAAGEAPEDQSDAAYWSAVRDLNTEDAYRAYLRRFPSGLFANEARRLLDQIADEPRRLAEAEEAALRLSANERRQVQRDLTYLGYDSGGIDGVFGRGTRAAISRYQRDRGFDQTGYLSRLLLQRLDQDVRARQTQLEEEDRRYWQRTGATGLERDLRAYLERYPNGLFAAEAEAQLAALTGDGDGRSRVAWDIAQAEDTIAAYRDFIAQFPNSRYVPDAEARIAALEADAGEDTQVAKDKAEERAVASNPVSRLLIERALDKLGHGPGVVDGQFDKRTRRAIRAFQKASNLPVTGFVSQQTMLRLTAASLR